MESKRKQYLKKYRKDNQEKIKRYGKQYRNKNKERISQRQKRDRAINPEKFILRAKQFYYKNKEKLKQYREANKERKKEYDGKYKQANKDKLKKYKRKYWEDNKERLRLERKTYRQTNKAKTRKYLNRKYKTNKEFRITVSLRNSFLKTFKIYTRTGKIYSSKQYGINYELIIEQLKPFPEDLSKYHIDHIKPLCSFSFVNEDGSTNLEEIKKAFAPENHQWLTIEENLKKGSRVISN